MNPNPNPHQNRFDLVPPELMAALLPFDLPEIIPLKTVNKGFNSLISEDIAFIRSYNQRSDTCSWSFVYYQDYNLQGVLHGWRVADGRQLHFPINDVMQIFALTHTSDIVSLLTCNGNLFLFFEFSIRRVKLGDDPDKLCVFDPFNNHVYHIPCPQDIFPLGAFFEKGFDIQITPNEHNNNDNIFCIKYVILRDGLPWVYEYHLPQDAEIAVNWVGRACVPTNTMLLTVEDQRNVMIDDGNEEVLYIIFFLDEINPPFFICHQHRDLVGRGFPMLPAAIPDEGFYSFWHIQTVGRWYLLIQSIRRIFFIPSESLRRIYIYEFQNQKEKGNGGLQLQLISGIAVGDFGAPLIVGIRTNDVCARELEGVIYVSFFGEHDDEGNIGDRFLFTYNIRNGEWSQPRPLPVLPPARNWCYSQSVTTRLTLSLPN